MAVHPRSNSDAESTRFSSSFQDVELPRLASDSEVCHSPLQAWSYLVQQEDLNIHRLRFQNKKLYQRLQILEEVRSNMPVSKFVGAPKTQRTL
jgi:hypothetical protein